MGKKSGKSNFGQELILNNWQIGTQNFIRLILLSMSLGFVAGLIWWGIFAPKNYFYYANLYVYSQFVCYLPFACTPTARYNLQVLPPFMQQVQGLFGACWNVFVITTVASVVGLRRYFVKRGQEMVSEQYLRGAKLLKPEELKLEIDGARDNQRKILYEENALDLWVGMEKIRIPESLTYRHISLAGVPGTGKTQVINSALKQIGQMKRQKCLIVDPNGQYYARFGQPGDKILSLYDKRSEPWSFWGEKVPAEFFSAALVELDHSGGNKFFSSAGRALLTDLVRLNNTTQGLWKDITSNPKDLLPKLQGGISPGLLGAPEQASGVIASASVEMGFLRNLNYWNQSEDFFSITEWALSDSEDWVFLIFKKDELSAVAPLLRLWFDLAVNGVLQRNENLDYPHLWAVCDELPSLRQLPSLPSLLAEGRKFKSSLISGYQGREQLIDIYKAEITKSILSNHQIKFICRITEHTSATDESKTLGEQDVEEISSSAQFGASPMADRNSINRAIKTRPVVLASEIQNLPDLHCYLKICHFDATRIRLDYQQYPAINEPTQCEIPPVKQPGAGQPSEEKNQPSDDEWASEPLEVGEDEDDEPGYDTDLGELEGLDEEKEANSNDFLNFSRNGKRNDK